MGFEPAPAEALYTEGEYLARHGDWHLGDAPGKARDILGGVLSAVRDRRDPDSLFRLADIGAGVGGVLNELGKLLAASMPSLAVESVAFEISPQAASKARELFPHLHVRQEAISREHGPFDAVMFADVLEHLENPREMLRIAAVISSHLIVRQPLLESFAMFRHDAYRNQRETWGHIGLFNYRSFLDMALASGWEPLSLQLLAPWELSGARDCGWHKKFLMRMNRVVMSQFVSGCYLNGCFRRIEQSAMTSPAR